MKINLSLRVLAVLFLSRESLHDATVPEFRLPVESCDASGRWHVTMDETRNEAIGFTRLTISRPLPHLDDIIINVISTE